jgi:hypothetical protein
MAEPAMLEPSCCICMEDLSSCGPSITCKGGAHVVCFFCLELYVKEEAAFNKQRITTNKGKLCCPGHSCANIFEHHELAQHLSPASFAELLSAWQVCIEQTAVLAAEEQARVAAEAEALKSAVTRARSHIIDNLLTLQCLRCHKAFENFDGCFAVQCRDTRGNGCRAHICAYCLECFVYPGDAHKHVVSCPHNTTKDRSLYGTQEGFTAVQKQRRTQLVQQFLKTLPLKLQVEVAATVERELTDLGIDLGAQQQQPARQTLREAAAEAAAVAKRAAAAAARAAQHAEAVSYGLMQAGFPYAPMPVAWLQADTPTTRRERRLMQRQQQLMDGPDNWVKRYWRNNPATVPRLHCNIAIGFLAASLAMLFRHEVRRR